MPSGEAANTNLIVFGLTRTELEHTIYCTDVVQTRWVIFTHSPRHSTFNMCLMYMLLNIFVYVLDENIRFKKIQHYTFTIRKYSQKLVMKMCYLMFEKCLTFQSFVPPLLYLVIVYVRFLAKVDTAILQKLNIHQI
jgi:hypothetical protein